MTTEHFSVFLVAYFVVALLISTIGLLSNPRRFARLLVFLLSLFGLVASTIVGSLVHGGENFLFSLYDNLVGFSRLHVLAFLFGSACALPLTLHWVVTGSRRSVFLPYLLTLAGIGGTLLFAGMSAGKDVISTYLPNPDTEHQVAGLGRLVEPEFSIEEYPLRTLIPVRMDVSPAGKVYISGHRGIAAQDGAIVELRAQSDGSMSEHLVAGKLNRPYGLIATDDFLLVSRSGQYTRWNQGTAEQTSTGAVTLLRDLDGNGEMDYYHDVVTDLPGAKGPDYLHQNNGLALDEDGSLYITTANHSDAYPVRDELAGVILRATGENFDSVETWATGLRNPFGLAFDGNGKLFATDNDSQSGVLGGNMGDKLIQVEAGKFYGHPFGNDGDDLVDSSVLRSKFSLGGLTFADSEQLPEKFRNHLYVVVYGEGRIMRIDADESGENAKTTLTPFATIPGAVDIAAAPNGDFYVAVYPDKIVKLTLNR